jgi:acyl carrier protein
MNKEEFISSLQEALEIEKDGNFNLLVKELDSIQVLALISFIDKNFSKTISITEIKKIENTDMLINLIGKENFK